MECSKMFIVSNTIKAKTGNEENVLKRFERLAGLENVPGFIMLNILKTKSTKDYDEFTIWSKWESKDAHDAWTKTESFRASHAGPRSEYILEFGLKFYDVIAEKIGIDHTSQDAI